MNRESSFAGLRAIFSFIFFLAVTGSGCATPPSLHVVSHDELLQKDNSLGNELAHAFESRLQIKPNTGVSEFMRGIAQSLVDVTPDLKGNSGRTSLFREKKGKWTSYALPGNRLYLPIGLLKTLDYENELAAVMALQLGHLVRRHLQARLEMQSQFFHLSWADDSPKSEDGTWSLQHSLQHKDEFQKVIFFGPDGVFAFSEDAEGAAAQTAVGIMYRTGYDPRGIISIYQRFKNNIKHSPFEMSTLMKVMEHARQEIAMYAPLRNPVVRSPRFLTLQKRIQGL